MSDNMKCKVLLLPTKDRKAGIYNSILFGLIYKEDATDKQDWQPMHLYFVSEEKIISGDWYITVQGSVFKSKCGTAHPVYSDRKIIASTDSSLRLPMISESFARHYVHCSGTITDVELEMVRWVDPECPIAIGGGMRLKLTDKNEVCIVAVRESNDSQFVEDATKKLVLGANGERIVQHLQDKKQALQDRVDNTYLNRIISDAANTYVNDVLQDINCIDRVEEAFKAGAEWYKNNIQK